MTYWVYQGTQTMSLFSQIHPAATAFFLTAFNLMSVTTLAFDFLPWTAAPLSFSLTLFYFLAKVMHYFTPIQGPFNKS